MAKTIDEFKNENSELVQELRRQLDEKDRILNTYKAGHGQLEVFFNSLLASVQAIKPKPIVYVPKDQKVGTTVDAVMQITDAHMGAVQEAG